MKLRDAIDQASQTIPRRDAETLLLHVEGRERAWLLAHPDLELTPHHAEDFLRLAFRRAAHEPLQYITGHQEFFGLDLRVTPDVLIPRPETELLVEAVLHWVAQESAEKSALVDVGTGSGAIALALASRLQSAEIWSLDLSSAALAVAQKNAARLGLAQRVRFAQSDLLDAFQQNSPRHADVIVSNPPYVPQGDAGDLQPEVRDYEPHLALFAGQDGLEVYRRLIPQAWQNLRPAGLLAMEFGFGQKPALTRLLQDWSDVQFLDDYASIPRVVLATRPRADDA